MNTLIPYAAAIVSVVAAVTALLGPGRKPDQIGIGEIGVNALLYTVCGRQV